MSCDALGRVATMEESAHHDRDPQPNSACPFPLSRLLQGIGWLAKSHKTQERHYQTLLIVRSSTNPLLRAK
jgi:hypothetical protein